MPEPIKRDSLNKTLESRYATQKIGGAFDARELDFVNFFSDEFTYGFTKGGQNTQFPRKQSALLKGFLKHKYQGS